MPVGGPATVCRSSGDQVAINRMSRQKTKRRRTVKPPRRKALDAGYDLDQILTTEDLVSGENVFFCATGVTEGDLLKGVRYYPGGCTTQSIVMRSKSGTVRMIEAYHRLSKLNEYSAIDFTGDSSAAYPLP